MSEPCQGTCSVCGDLCAGAERAERIAGRDALRAEVERLRRDLADAILVRNERWARHKEANARLLAAAAEVAELHADNERLRAEVERLGQIITHAALDHMAAEVDRLRAVLGDCLRAVLEETPENVQSLCALWEADPWSPPRGGELAVAILAALRARGGLTDLEAAEVNHGQGDEGAQAQPPGAAVAPTGQAGGEQSGSAGPPAGPYPKATIRAADDPLWANPRSPAGLHPCSKCDCRAFDYEVGEHPGICNCRHSDHDHGMSNGRLAADRARAGIT